MTTAIRYAINTPKVVHETFEDEVIVIHLDTGSYYSLAGSGAAVWSQLERGATPDDITEALAAHYSGAREDMAHGARQLLDELLAEDLIREAAAATGHGADFTAPPIGAPLIGARPPFKPPALSKHTEMADLLLLDPIHEVDETGWPNVPPVAEH